MKTITLENGTKVQISDESYQALQKAVQKPVWKDVVMDRMLSKTSMDYFGDYGSDRFSWLNNEQSQKEFEIYLHMLLWKDTYDKGYEPNWEDEYREKWSIYYKHNYKKWGVYAAYSYQEILQVYVSSKEKANQMIEDLKSIGVL